MKTRDPLGDALELRSIRVGFSIHVVVAIVLCFMPLFDVLGFERAFVSGLFATPISAAVGISMVRSARERGGDDLARIAAHAIGISLLMLVPTLVAGVIVELASQPCDQQQGILFLLLVAGGNAIFGAALGAAAAVVFPRKWLPGIAVALTLGAFVLVALAELYSEPQIFVYSVPFGYWPGSLYDEELEVTSALWVFRAFSTLAAVAVLSAVRAVSRPATLSLATDRPRATAILGTLVFACAAVAVQQTGEALGIRINRETIERELSRHVRTEHFDLFIAPSVSKEQVSLLIEDHELRYTQLARFFGYEPHVRIRSFVYATEKQKRRLMGASATQIARPWANEVHIDGFAVPHPVLKHELAHVFAGSMATGTFKVPASAIVLVNIGIVEGIAVAADWPSNELTIHAWAHAMRQLGLAPDLRGTLDAVGFWSISSARAYTLAGSFVRWLIEQGGIAKFATLYATNDFEKAYQRPLAELVPDWEKFVDTVPLSKEDLLIAEHRFKRPGIFEKICAHRAANLSKQGYQRLRSGDLDGGIDRLEQLLSYAPTTVQPLIDIANALARDGRLDDARRFAKRALETQGVTAKNAAEAKEAMAGIEWREGDTDKAHELYQQILALHVSRASDRLQMARLESLARPAEDRELLGAFLRGDLPSAKALVKLGELAQRRPNDGLVRYLYGRQLDGIGAHEEAVRELEAASAFGVVPNPQAGDATTPATRALAEEAEMTLGKALLRAHRTSDAEARFVSIARSTQSEAIKETAEDWAERARFVAKTGTVGADRPRAGVE